MMIEPIYIARRELLKKYMEERKHAPKPPRTQLEVALLIGMRNDKQFAQLVAPIEKDGKRNPGWRRINTDMAQRMEDKLGIRGMVDGRAIELATPAPNEAASEPISGPFAKSRDKNDLLAVWYALFGMARFLHRSQQQTAVGVAQEIVALAGVDFAKQGSVNTLVGNLLGVQDVSVEVLHDLLRQSVSSTSRRTTLPVKKT